MAISLSELALANTGLGGDGLRHVQRLVASWQVLADLSFSDLLLFAPVDGEAGHRFVVLAHVRPMTGQTLYPADLVGTVMHEVERPVIARAWRKGEVVGGDTTILGGRNRVRVQCIPVRFEGSTVAVMTRESAMTSARRPGLLEKQYFDVFDKFVHMTTEGLFPFPHDEIETEEAPQVANGVVILDDQLRMRFASPNAMSALHRMGIHAFTEGMQPRDIGFDQSAAEVATAIRLPVNEEMERGDFAVLIQALPLLEREEVTGVVLLVRDVTELRRRDRILISKDATIREIHHRVKNNLQTIAALLRLQMRRLDSREAREALEESERRIRLIAIVHETLSRDASDVVSFGEILRPLVRIVEETVSTDEQRLSFEVEGDAGDVVGEIATLLAVILNELMQNAVDHAFPRGEGEAIEGHIRVKLGRIGDTLSIVVRDDGVGLPPGFSLERSKGLGLSIVHALVTSELRGSIEMRNDAGTEVLLRVPVTPVATVEL
ncbi:MAG TPA: sensor histidine kinase [Acidimicrobiia bacterium]|nr:sensor histidine kinase [Acidimicrobiia bacterium]